MIAYTNMSWNHFDLFTLFAFALIVSLSGCHPNSRSDRAPLDLSVVPARSISDTTLSFVSSGEDRFADRAKFLAENAALADVANECSLVPVGTQIESIEEKFESTESRIFFARAVIDRKACESAQSAHTPETIREIADRALTEQVQKYRDVMGEVSSPSNRGLEKTLSAGANDERSYLELRQQIAYQKQSILLDVQGKVSPELTRSTTAIRDFEARNPDVRTSRASWSSIQRRRMNTVPDPVLSNPSEEPSDHSAEKNRNRRPRTLPPKSYPKGPRKPR